MVQHKWQHDVQDFLKALTMLGGKSVSMLIAKWGNQAQANLLMWLKLLQPAKHTKLLDATSAWSTTQSTLPVAWCVHQTRVFNTEQNLCPNAFWKHMTTTTTPPYLFSWIADEDRLHVKAGKKVSLAGEQLRLKKVQQGKHLFRGVLNRRAWYTHTWWGGWILHSIHIPTQIVLTHRLFQQVEHASNLRPVDNTVHWSQCLQPEPKYCNWTILLTHESLHDQNYQRPGDPSSISSRNKVTIRIHALHLQLGLLLMLFGSVAIGWKSWRWFGTPSTSGFWQDDISLCRSTPDLQLFNSKLRSSADLHI